jgi:AcrR family transcriptional regulator
MSSRRLARAAAELILEKGWEATTAAEIGRRAGYSRAMVHARYGSKDAVLDAIFMREYMAQLSPDLDPDASGLQHALAHLDRIGQLAAEDAELLRAMFVAAFEAVKSTSALRPRSLGQLDAGMQKVRAGLEKGISDGSVRPDVDVERAVNDISSSVYGIAYLWLVLTDGYDLAAELKGLRARLIRDYGSPGH